MSVLNRRQARHAQFFTHFDFQITFHLGKQQGKVDALSRLLYLAPHPSDPTFNNQKHAILGLARSHATTTFDTALDSSIIDTICHNLKT